jgi:sigma-B regulation protein RsbU (phosphoserine phosphatase)
VSGTEPTVESGTAEIDSIEQRPIHDKVSTYRRLASALEQIADSVLITDRHGVIDYVNPAFEATTGYKSEEVLGKTPSILKSGHHDQEFYRELWHEISDGRPFQCTIRNKKRTGELYWAQQTITPIRESGDEITHYVSVLKDITDLLDSKEKEAKLRLVRAVQQKFYQARASLTGFDIAAIAHPADETGGDYFDFINLPDGCLGIAVGDVSGHGIGTALVMTETRAFVRAAATTCSDVVQIMTQVNQLLVQDLTEGQFVTLFLARLDPANKELTYASAGHNPGYVLEASGGIIQTLGGTGIPLGLYSDASYSANGYKFADAGQMLFLSTDGVTEAADPNDTQFGIKRVVQHFAYQGHRSAQQIINSLYEKIRIHTNHMPQQDDITAMMLKSL